MKKRVLLSFFVVFFFLNTVLLLFATDFNFYGFFKLNMAYDSGYLYPGNFALYSKDPEGTKNLFYLSINESRFGVNIKGNKVGDFNLTGKVEVDFMGGGPENKSHLKMRHAYLKISNKSFSILAGQTWDIIAPLNPLSFNYSVMWFGGNIGFRRVQLRIENNFEFGGGNRFKIQAGIFRTIAQDYDLNGIDDDVSSGMPSLQARVSSKINIAGSSFFEIGLSGHYGKIKTFVSTASDNSKNYITNSLDFDFLFKSKYIKIMGEYFNGKNLGTFLAGIGQDINLDKGVEISSRGGWFDFIITPTKKLTIGAGYSVDNPDDKNLSEGDKSKNSVIFGNIIYKIKKELRFGVEINRWTTEYYKENKFSANRFQFVIMYLF